VGILENRMSSFIGDSSLPGESPLEQKTLPWSGHLSKERIPIIGERSRKPMTEQVHFDGESVGEAPL